MKLFDCDVLILCGGEGSRIRHLLPEGYPKIMADVNGTPFFDIFRFHLISSGFRRFIVCTGYGHDIVAGYWLRTAGWRKLPTKEDVATIFCREARPLGTAGVVKYAWEAVNGDHCFVLNGDTYCDVDYAAMFDYHLKSKSVITVAHDDQMRHVGTFMASRRLIGLIPETDGKYDMEDLFMLLGKLRESVGWFRTEAEFWDIGSPEGLETFQREEPWKKTKGR